MTDRELMEAVEDLYTYSSDHLDRYPKYVLVEMMERISTLRDALLSKEENNMTCKCLSDEVCGDCMSKKLNEGNEIKISNILADKSIRASDEDIYWRNYYAGLAMQAIISNYHNLPRLHGTEKADEDVVSEQAFKQADAMLKARGES